jgi:hypothetical protein
MSSSFPDSFTQPGDDSVPSTGSTRPFDDDGHLGYDPRLPSQRFDSFAATHFADSDSLKDSATDSPMFHSNNNNDNSFSGGDDVFASQPDEEIYAEEANGEGFDGGFPGSDGPILPPPMEMEPEEGFALREWRRYGFEFHLFLLVNVNRSFLFRLAICLVAEKIRVNFPNLCFHP